MISYQLRPWSTPQYRSYTPRILLQSTLVERIVPSANDGNPISLASVKTYCRNGGLRSRAEHPVIQTVVVIQRRLGRRNTRICCATGTSFGKIGMSLCYTAMILMWCHRRQLWHLLPYPSNVFTGSVILEGGWAQKVWIKILFRCHPLWWHTIFSGTVSID